MQRHRASLHDLPQELLSEVASYLDFVDILSLQRTSKKLNKSGEAHIVWLTLAKKYSERHFHLYHPETGSFDDLRTAELRAWIRKRLVVDQIWRARRARPHSRIIRSEGILIVTLKLVPGTRWLLVGYKDGSVCSCDLDSEGVKQVPLTPPSSTVNGVLEGVNDLEIHVDEGTPRLEFKLVIRMTDGDREGLGWLHVWQVKLKDDKNSLAAERLNSIPYGSAFVNSLYLGRHLIVCSMSSLVGPSWVEIIWWEQCSVTSDLRTRFLTGCERIDKIHLFGDDKILGISREGIVSLYTLPEPNHANGYVQMSLIQSEHSPRREPLWELPLARGWQYSYPVCHKGTADRLIVSTRYYGILGLVLPTTNDDRPSVVKLSNASERWDRCIPGICKAYAFRGEGKADIRIGYSWDDGDTPTIMGRRKDVAPPGRHLTFDEQVGRFLYLSGRDIVVVDYVH